MLFITKVFSPSNFFTSFETMRNGICARVRKIDVPESSSTAGFHDGVLDMKFVKIFSQIYADDE